MTRTLATTMNHRHEVRIDSMPPQNESADTPRRSSLTRTTLRAASVLSVVFCSALILVGCGGNNDGDPSAPSPAADEATDPSPDSTEEAVQEPRAIVPAARVYEESHGEDVDADDEPLITERPSGPVFWLPRTDVELPEDSPAGWARDPEHEVNIVAADLTGNGLLDVMVPGGLDGGGGLHNTVVIQHDVDEFVIDLNHPLAAIADVTAVLFGNFNSNGLVDAYICRIGPNQLWRQSERGQWVEVTESEAIAGGPSGGSHYSVDGAIFDANSNGLLDILVVNHDGPNELLLNDGNGAFRSAGEESGLAGDPDRAERRQVVVFDLNGDGVIHVMYLRDQPPHEVYRSDGAGAFSTADGFDALRRRTIHSAVAVDFNGNGVTDLIVTADDGDSPGRVERWSADDEGEWGVAEVIVEDLDWSINRLPVGARGERPRIACADVTGDGRFEVVVSDGTGLIVADAAGEVLYNARARRDRTWAIVQMSAAEGPSIFVVNQQGRLLLLPPGRGRFGFAGFSFTGVHESGRFVPGIGVRAMFSAGDWTASVPSYRFESGPGQSSQPFALGLRGYPRFREVTIHWPDRAGPTGDPSGRRRVTGLRAGELHIIGRGE